MAEDEKPKGWDISRSHVPNLEDFLQGLYINQFVSVEPTSAQFSALSARVALLVAVSATSNKVSLAIAVETSNRISADNVLSNQISVLSNQVSVLSQAVSVLSNQISVLSQGQSVLSNAISGLSQQVSVHSQQISVLSNQVSVLSQTVSVLSNTLSVLKAVSPGGRLTLTTLTPVLAAAVTAATTIFYTPYFNDVLPIYDGTTLQASSTAQLTMSLDNSVPVSSTNSDGFAVNDAGTRRIGTGPAWTSNTARGAGAGTTELSRKDGIWTNANIISSVRYGSLAVSAVAVNTATYLGTFRTTATPGQTEQSFARAPSLGGTEDKLYLWNLYNRVVITTIVMDATDSWTYTGNSVWRSSDNSATMRVSFVRGLNEDGVEAVFNGACDGTAPALPADGASGIGLDATNAYTGLVGYLGLASLPSGNLTPIIAFYQGYPGLGYHFLQAIEFTSSAAQATTFFGDGGVPSFVQTGLLVLVMG